MTNIEPRLDADEIPEAFQHPARTLARRIAEKPELAGKAFGIFAEYADPTDDQLESLTKDMDKEGTEFVRYAGSVLIDSLPVFLTFDSVTRERIATDPEHQKLTSTYMGNKVEIEDRPSFKRRIYASELKHYSNRVHEVKTARKAAATSAAENAEAS